MHLDKRDDVRNKVRKASLKMIDHDKKNINLDYKKRDTYGI